MKKIYYVALALVVLLAGVGASQLRASGKEASVARVEELMIETTSGKHNFHVEIADTPASQELGLMHRKSMPQDHGMLFEVDKKNPQRISLWMKNTLIPLDMIFIDPQGKIVGIVENAEPHTLTPRGPDVLSAAVLELNGGAAAKNGIKVGDTVVHPFFE